MRVVLLRAGVVWGVWGEVCAVCVGCVVAHFGLLGTYLAASWPLLGCF